MISQKTIDAVRELDLVQVISSLGVELKKSGANWMSKSPFTEEKTPSFSVSPSKGFYKCFSSGKGGNNGISFLMEWKNLTYIEAIREIAERNGIIIEMDDSESSKKYIEKQQNVRQISEVNNEALNFFEQKLSEVSEDKLRYPIELLQQLRIGFAPDSFDALISHLLQLGFSKDQLLKSGIAKQSEKGSIYSFFRNRIIFPIFTPSGVLVGFSGRSIGEEKKGKYINTADTEAYSKSESILGISFSKEYLRKEGKAIRVEGNFDFIALYSKGIKNVVAPLGTSFTEDQCKIIRKYASELLIFADTDAAGIKALESNIKTALSADLTVSIYIHKSGPGKKEDPDSIVRSKDWICTDKENELKELIESEQQDAVEYLADLFFKDAKSIPQKSKAESQLAELIALIPNQKLRNDYIKSLATNYKINKKSVESEVSATLLERAQEEEEQNGGHKLPTYLKREDHEEFREFMFYEDPSPNKIGYYFPYASGSSFERVTNFLIRPIFQLGSVSDGGRVCEIRNKNKTKVKVLPKDAFNNPSVFENELSVLGDFRFDGAKKHLQRLRAKLYPKFIMHEEITTLGWHRDGFWAFADGIVDGSFKRVDKYGSIQYNEKFYFLPAFSAIHDDLPEENDNYASDRKSVYRGESKITAKEWFNWMARIYTENGLIGAAYLFTCLFRDYIYQEMNHFPILFGFGRPGTGKTTMGRSLSSVFFDDTTPFNLNNGTPVGFQRKLAAMKNAIIHLDEYHNNLDEKKFQSLKGTFDGTGHEAGVKDNTNRTKVTKINSSPYVSGQYLPTRDDNSLYTRSILLQFTKSSNEFTEEEKRWFKEFNQIEELGLSSVIVEVVKFRDLVKKNFLNGRFEIEQRINRALVGRVANGRVIEQYSIVLTIFQILSEAMNLTISEQSAFEQLYDLCLKNIQIQSSQIQESNTLSKYWKMIEFMSENHQIRNNFDYAVKTIEANKEFTVRVSGKETKKVMFDSPTRVLYIKLNKVHPLYLETIKRQTSENGIPESSIMSYMKSDISWIGAVPVFTFETGNTSAYAFKYDSLNIQLAGIPLDYGVETTKPTTSTTPTTEDSVLKIWPTESNEKDDDLPF